MARTTQHFWGVTMAGWLLAGLTSAVHAQGLPVFEITAKDGRLTPAQLQVPAGQRIKLVIHNASQGPIEFENLTMHIEKVLGAGATSFVVLPALLPGSYEFVDEFHSDTARMQVIAK